jgi:S-DNA-T family DNA segregation ATPase FtsK/SpoIIIE
VTADRDRYRTLTAAAVLLVAAIAAIVSYIHVASLYHRLSDLPGDICPEGKLTREIARDPRYSMPVRALVLDEFQEWFDLGEISKDIAPLLVFLLKVAPGAGVSVIAATQKPSGVGTGQTGQQFTSCRDNFAVRFARVPRAGRCRRWSSARAPTARAWTPAPCCRSTRASEFSAAPPTRAQPSAPTSRTVRTRTGYSPRRGSCGSVPEPCQGWLWARPSRKLPRFSLTCWACSGSRTGCTGKSSPDCCGSGSHRHADATAESVSAQCRAAGVPSVDVKMLGQVRNGCRRADVGAVLPR